MVFHCLEYNRNILIFQLPKPLEGAILKECGHTLSGYSQSACAPKRRLFFRHLPPYLNNGEFKIYLFVYSSKNGWKSWGNQWTKWSSDNWRWSGVVWPTDSTVGTWCSKKVRNIERDFVLTIKKKIYLSLYSTLLYCMLLKISYRIMFNSLLNIKIICWFDRLPICVVLCRVCFVLWRLQVDQSWSVMTGSIRGNL